MSLMVKVGWKQRAKQLVVDGLRAAPSLRGVHVVISITNERIRDGLKYLSSTPEIEGEGIPFDAVLCGRERNGGPPPLQNPVLDAGMMATMAGK